MRQSNWATKRTDPVLPQLPEVFTAICIRVHSGGPSLLSRFLWGVQDAPSFMDRGRLRTLSPPTAVKLARLHPTPLNALAALLPRRGTSVGAFPGQEPGRYLRVSDGKTATKKTRNRPPPARVHISPGASSDHPAMQTGGAQARENFAHRPFLPLRGVWPTRR